MDPKIETVLQSIMNTSELQQVMRQEDPEFVGPEDFVLAIGPEAGNFIHELALQKSVKNVLEVGTSHGYSTLWLADVVKQTGGSVITLEKRESKVKYATSNFEKAGVSSLIEIKQGNAKEILKELDGEFDLVFIDARKDEYVEYFELVKDKVRVGGLIVADNMLYPPQALPFAKKYQEYVSSLDNFSTRTVTVGSGLEVSEKIK